ncbi:MAG: M48 family metallopeptidase [bacterium]
MNFKVFKYSICILFIGWLTGCADVPESGESKFMLISPSEEAQMGEQAFDELKKEKKISKDMEATLKVQRVAERVIEQVDPPKERWEIVVFEEPTPNAFALSGRKVGVYDGLMPFVYNDAQLAAVIGHEVAHVKLRHSGQRFSQQLVTQLGISTLDVAMKQQPEQTRQLWMNAAGAGSDVFVTLPYSHGHEYEADRYGLNYMARAGYDPREAVAFWKRMQEYENKNGGQSPAWFNFLSTHPTTPERIQALEKQLPEAIALYERSPKN